VRLNVLGARQRPQVRNDLCFIARREECREQNDVGQARVDRRNRVVARVDDDQFGMDRSRIMRLRIVAWRRSGSGRGRGEREFCKVETLGMKCRNAS
jgi:hypothetical protein